MTDREKLMYQILGKISDLDLPIVFKGALITKLILVEQDFNEIRRMTKDIDANWVDTPPSMDHLVNTINLAISHLGNQYLAEMSRVYSEKQSAGISIKERSTGDEIISMDIDIKPLISSRIYYLGETSIKGVLANEILADKISSISSNAVYKHRAKDIVDVYALSHCVEINVDEILEICKKAGREIQAFDAFFNRRADVEHAYNKLRGIEGKPEFSDVHKYLIRFIQPFKDKEKTYKIWNCRTAEWKES